MAGEDPWTLLAFGDSWAAHELCDSWPEVLGCRLGARVLNFAQGGSLCGALASQGEKALESAEVPRGPGGLLHPRTLVVVHSCGNDFLFKLVVSLFKGGVIKSDKLDILRPHPGAREAAVVASFLRTLHAAGARHFLVSGVPVFSRLPALRLALPAFKRMVNEGKMQNLGVKPGDSPERVLEVQSASLRSRWTDMVTEFGRDHSEAVCLFFDEVGALEHLRHALGEKAFDSSAWDFTKIHPSAFGHEQLAEQAHRCLAQGIPALAAGARGTPAEAPAPPRSRL